MNIYELKIESQKTINELKSLDYKTNKYIEGELTDAEWQEVIARRKTLRNKLNTLKDELNSLMEGK